MSVNPAGPNYPLASLYVGKLIKKKHFSQAIISPFDSAERLVSRIDTLSNSYFYTRPNAT